MSDDVKRILLRLIPLALMGVVAFFLVRFLLQLLWPERMGAMLWLLIFFSIGLPIWLGHLWRRVRRRPWLYFLFPADALIVPIYLMALLALIFWGPRLVLYGWGKPVEAVVVDKRAVEYVDEQGVKETAYEVRYTFVSTGGQEIRGLSGLDKRLYETVAVDDSLIVYYAPWFPRFVTTGDPTLFTKPVVLMLWLNLLMAQWLGGVAVRHLRRRQSAGSIIHE